MLDIKRLDHFGLVAGVIKDLELVKLIDSHFEKDDKENISTGEAVAGMIINGLGFTQRPMSLTPMFFKNKPLDILFREGISPSHFNRFKLGRALDDLHKYGNEALFSEIALHICEKEGIERQYSHLDTTSFSLTGEYLPDSDEKEILITHGYSKDHRPDLKQAVLELVVTQDGGIPLICKCHDVNASDNTVFKDRVAAFIEQIKMGDQPTIVVMDSKGYTEKNAEFLRQIDFITRVPGTFGLEGAMIDQALYLSDKWEQINEAYKIQSFYLKHLGFDQRWVVVWSKGAFERAGLSLDKKSKKEKVTIDKELKKLSKQGFDNQEEALEAFEKIEEKWKYHKVESIEYEEIIKYAKPGRPTANSPIDKVEIFIKVKVTENSAYILEQQRRGACFVLATNVVKNRVSDEEILINYKKQSGVERGFRFLKDPLFFASSLFVKKPSRIAGLLMVMTLSLMVYNIAERRMRNELNKQEETIPNQIGKPTATPTLRWVFQIFEGINYVKRVVDNKIECIVDGVTSLHKKIIRLFGKTVCGIYQLIPI
jgi:transposase